MDVARYGAGVWVGAVEWWVGSLIGQKGLCGFLLSFFCFFFSPLHPVPRSLLLITDGPPLTMPCMHARCKSNGRGEGCVGWMWWVCVGG